MDNPKPERYRFQFSLRKLMLWTAVWAAYLSAHRLVLNYLNALGIVDPLPVYLSLTAYVAVLLFIRIKCGSKWGARIIVLGTILVPICIAETRLAIECLNGRSPETMVESQWILIPIFNFGLLLSAIGFTFAHALVLGVDWIESLMQTKPPQEQ